MKIAVVFDQMLWGGIERVGISYIKLLTEAGYEVDAYILKDNPEGIVEDLKKICNVTVRQMGYRECPEIYWGIALEYDWGGLETVWFGLKYWGCKVLNSMLKPFRRIPGKRYDIAIAFSGHIKDLTFVAEKYIDAKYTMAWLHGTQYQYNLLSPGFYRLYRKIQNLVCLSDKGDADCLKYNQKNRIRKRKIYNPCIVKDRDIDEEYVAQLRKNYGDFCLMVGRLDIDKDQETVIRAMAYIKEKYGLSKKLVLVGDGPKRQYLENVVRDCNMEDSVIFEGSRSDVQNYYSAASIYVHGAPLEGLPTVFLEAMHFGLPIVSTEALPGAEEILGNNEYGLISPNWDSVAFAENIVRIYSDEKLRGQLVARGKERILDFGPQKVFEQLLDYIQEITNDN